MALIGNRSILHKSPGGFLNGNAATGGAIANLRSNKNKAGQVRNSVQSLGRLAAIPDGHLSPSAWFLPTIGGGMSSVNFANIEITASGAGAQGVNIDGAASITISMADADGQLISSGTGSASFTITSTGSLLASLSAVGDTSISISTNTPLLGALGWVLADTSFALNATMTSYGVGFMSGSTEDSGVLTVDTIAAGVWQYTLTNNDTADATLSSTGVSNALTLPQFLALKD